MIHGLAEAMDPILRKAYRAVMAPPAPNLRGDRDIEYSFVAANMPDGPGNALDFGAGPFWMGLLAARKGFNVTAIDLTEVSWPYEYPGLRFLRGDIFDAGFQPRCFDLIINCSAIEHVGLTGRYGVRKERPDGDLEAMELLVRILKPQGLMLLTIPVGCDHVFSPLHRVYGHDRQPRLLQGLQIVKEEYWIKDHLNKWNRTDKAQAFAKEPLPRCYGLGLYILRHSASV